MSAESASGTRNWRLKRDVPSSVLHQSRILVLGRHRGRAHRPLRGVGLMCAFGRPRREFDPLCALSEARRRPCRVSTVALRSVVISICRTGNPHLLQVQRPLSRQPASDIQTAQSVTGPTIKRTERRGTARKIPSRPRRSSQSIHMRLSAGSNPAIAIQHNRNMSYKTNCSNCGKSHTMAASYCPWCGTEVVLDGA